MSEFVIKVHVNGKSVEISTDYGSFELNIDENDRNIDLVRISMFGLGANVL